MGTIDDTRTDEQRAATLLLVVATDSFMSGWGRAPRRSLYAVAVPDGATSVDVEARMDSRSDFKRVRVVGPTYRPRLRDGDHLKVVWHESFTYQPSA